jgi:hypothetical protein
MKTTSFIFALGIALAVASNAWACDKAKDQKEAKAAPVEKGKISQPQSAQQESKVALTGSYIKRDVRRNGQITDGPSQVAVIDAATIKNSGAADLRQLLVRQGASH